MGHWLAQAELHEHEPHEERHHGDHRNGPHQQRRKYIRSSLGCALAMSSAPLVDIGLTSTTEELMAMAVITPIGVRSGSMAIGSTTG